MIKTIVQTVVTGLCVFSAPSAFAQISDLEKQSETQRYIVKYQANTKYLVAAEIERLKGEIKLAIDNHRLFSVDLSVDQIEALSARAEIEFIEIDPKRYLMAETVGYGIPMVEASLVSESVVDPRKVCIIDTGFDLSHPDLQALRVTGDNQVQFTTVNGTVYYTIDNGPWQNDPNGHGTAMGGIIAALGNSIGVRGVNPGDNLDLHIVKAFSSPNANIPTMSFWTYGSRTIHALDQCLQAGADIVNMSYGGSIFSQAENQALIAASNSNVILVGAAGNSGTSDPKYPASLDAVISVGSIDIAGAVAGNSQHHNSNEITAPGVAITSTHPGNTYSTGSGTSGAAAHVTGIGALVWGNYPSCSAHQIRLALRNTAEEVGALGWDPYYGYGIVKAKKAFDALSTGCVVPAQSPQIQNGLTMMSLISAAGTQLNFTMNVPASPTNTVAATKAGTTAISNSMTVPAGASNLSFVTTGGTGDADLYVRYGAKPTTEIYDCVSNGADSNETCNIQSPQAGEYHVMLKANSLFYGVSLTGTYSDGSGSGNQAPVAKIKFNCSDLQCAFEGDESSDIDGHVVSYDWDFGDGIAQSGVTTSHSFQSAGTYYAALTVTDNDAVTHSTTQIVEVTESPNMTIHLDVKTHRKKNKKKKFVAFLNWDGATSRRVDLYVNGKLHGRTKNDGQTKIQSRRIGGSTTYQICNEDSVTDCSEITTASNSR